MDAREFLARMEKGDDFGDVVKDGDRDAEQTQLLLNLLDKFPIGAVAASKRENPK